MYVCISSVYVCMCVYVCVCVCVHVCERGVTLMFVRRAYVM